MGGKVQQLTSGQAIRRLVASAVLLIYSPLQAQDALQTPVTTPQWNNGYGAFNRAGNNMYHTGVDFSGPRKTLVKAAGRGSIIRVVGLAPQYGGAETIYLWNDRNGDRLYSEGEEEGPQETGRVADNHGLGTTLIVSHLINGVEKYTVYGHLDAVRKDIYEMVVQQNQPVSVEPGQPIALMGFTTYDNRDDSNIHVHFEVKKRPVLGSISDDAPYWGYTPDSPTPHGYDDPWLAIYPPPTPAIGGIAVKVVGEEGGLSETDRGVRLYAGPGVSYSVLGWTGKDQVFVSDASVRSLRPGDSQDGRLWYRIGLPGFIGPSSAWIASRRNDGTLLVQAELVAKVVTVINDGGIGWRLRLGPGGSELINVYDKFFGFRQVHAWNQMQFVSQGSQTVAGKAWHSIYLPKLFFRDPSPSGTGEVAPPQDNVVGEIETAWLASDALIVEGGINALTGDINSDGRVDVNDLGKVLIDWGKSTQSLADVNQDGIVNVLDLSIVLSHWS